MAEFSNYQKNVIRRYYEHRETLALSKLGELVSELYLATGERKIEQLWKRVEAQMANLKVPEKIAGHILGQRDVELLARHLQEWSEKPPVG